MGGDAIFVSLARRDVVSGYPLFLTCYIHHPQITVANLREIFGPFGELEEVALLSDPESGTSLGVAKIIYDDPQHAEDAQHAINDLELVDKRLVVRLATKSDPRYHGCWLRQ